MSASTITILFLIFAIVSFILEKIPLGLTATIVAIGLNVTGVLDASTDIQRICKQQRYSVRWNVCSRAGTF